MPITGVFFIPSNPNAPTALATVTERLRSAFADEPIPIGRWALEHKLMRDTPSCLPASANISRAPLKPRYMQFLSLSHYPNHGFIYTSHSEEEKPTTQPGAANANTIPPMIMTTVPLQSYGTLFQHFVYACQPFWCHRHTVTVPGGIVYDVGDFRVRIGDVRQTQPTARIRGTVVEVEWKGPSLVSSIPTNVSSNTAFNAADDDDGDADSGIDLSPSAIEDADIDAEYAATATLIREFWARLGIEGAREAILVPDVGREVKSRLQRWKRKEKESLIKHVQRDIDGWDGNRQQQDEDPDPDAGADLARQFMEIFRFNR